MRAEVQRLIDGGLGDARVLSIAWSGDDLDLRFELAGRSGESGQLLLRFVYTVHLVVNMDFGDIIGSPLVFSADVEPAGSVAWSVVLDFGGVLSGFISFKCVDILRM